MYVQTTKNKAKHAGERAPSRRLFRFVSFCIVSCLRVTQHIQGRPLSRAAAATAYVAS